MIEVALPVARLPAKIVICKCTGRGEPAAGCKCTGIGGSGHCHCQRTAGHASRGCSVSTLPFSISEATSTQTGDVRIACRDVRAGEGTGDRKVIEQRTVQRTLDNIEVKTRFSPDLEAETEPKTVKLPYPDFLKPSTG